MDFLKYTCDKYASYPPKAQRTHVKWMAAKKILAEGEKINPQEQKDAELCTFYRCLVDSI
jgi:hypothetical protein